MSNEEFYYPHEDNGELLFKNMLLKLNTILIENQQINKKFVDLNRRLEAQAISHKIMKESLDRILLKQNPGEWTVIQRRQDGSVDFNRSWLEYRQGFGWPNGEFFIGLEKLHALTTRGATQELWIVLKDFENETRYAIYDKFVISSEADKYSLKELGLYRGTAGDYLSYHKDKPFSTYDTGICAPQFKGGWWFQDLNCKNTNYSKCYYSNLNGAYLKAFNPNGGTAWGGFHGWNYSLKFVEMLIRSIP